MNSKLDSWTCVCIISNDNVWIWGIYSPFLAHRGLGRAFKVCLSLYYQFYAMQIGMGFDPGGVLWDKKDRDDRRKS